MKKMIVTGIAFLFLLAVVAGCPSQPSGNSQSEGSKTPTSAPSSDVTPDTMDPTNDPSPTSTEDIE